jgi:hypothetical protein
MANPNAPFGFKVWNAGGGGTPARLEEGSLVAAYGTALYTGDALTLAADGTLAIASAGGAVIGIFDGVEYTQPDGTVVFKSYWAASTATKSGTVIRVKYIPAEGHIFYAQSAGSMTLADVGQWVDISTGTAGSALTGRSGMQTSATGGSEVSFSIVGVLGARVHAATPPVTRICTRPAPMRSFSSRSPSRLAALSLLLKSNQPGA